MSEYYLDGIWYRKESYQWEKDLYGTDVASVGDLLFNNISEDLDSNDLSKEAEHRLNQAFYLLNSGKRWPNNMTPVQPAGAKPYRKQSSTTRDPWIVCYTQAMKLEKVYMIEAFKPKARLRIPSFNVWRKYLITGKDIYLKIYDLIKGIPTEDYVVKLSNYMEDAIEFRKKYDIKLNKEHENRKSNSRY